MQKGVKTSKKQKKTTVKNTNCGSEKCMSVLLYNVKWKKRTKRSKNKKINIKTIIIRTLRGRSYASKSIYSDMFDIDSNGDSCNIYVRHCK